MTADLVDRLRRAGQDCECNAYHSGECSCDAVWADDMVDEAADEIERLRREHRRMVDWIERLVGNGCECPPETPSRIPACHYCHYKNWLEEQ